MSSQSESPSTSGVLSFHDALSCRAWIKTIPLTNITQAQQRMLDALRMFSRAETSAMDRLTCLEMLRDKLGYLLTEQRKRYRGKLLPLANTDTAAWQAACELLQEMENGYRRCSKYISDGDPSLLPHAALVIQRTMRYIGLQMLMAGFVYRRFDTDLWVRLHALWREAEQLQLTTRLVKDSIGTSDIKSSVMQAYAAVLLGQAANVYALTPQQIDFVDALLKRLGYKVIVSVTPPTADSRHPAPKIGTIELLSDRGSEFYTQPLPADERRFLDMGGLSKSLRTRMQKLAEGSTPGDLDLPAEWSAGDALSLLKRLHKIWCDGTTSWPQASVPKESAATVTFGIAETHYFLSGIMFEQPDVKRELTRQELGDITMFGKVSEATARARYANFNYFSESWGLVEEGKNFVRLLRPGKSNRGVAIGKLVGIKIGDTDVFYLGVIHEIFQEADNNIVVTLDMLPGKPGATALRTSNPKGRNNNSYTQGFHLPPLAALGIPETLIVPNGIAQPGSSIDIFHPGQGNPKQVTLTEFMERGMDFDRVKIT